MKCLAVNLKCAIFPDVVFKGEPSIFNFDLSMWYCRLRAEITHIRGLLVQSTHLVEPLMNAIVTR